jgi:hypothetical protein
MVTGKAVRPRFSGVPALALALMGAGACNAILGNDEPTIADDAGADGSSPTEHDGSSPVGDGGSTNDGSSTNDGNASGDAGSDAPFVEIDSGPLPACMGAVCFVAAKQAGPYEIAVDSTYVYFTNQGATPALDGGGGDGGGAVMRVNLDGSNPTALVLGLHAPREILLDTNNVYWLSHDTPDDDGGGAGCIGMVAKTGGAASFPVTSIPDDLLGLAMYEGNLVWGQPVEGLVGENLADAGGPIHMASGQFDVGGLVADSTGVYDLASSENPDGLPAILQTVTIGGGGLDTRSTQLYEYQDPVIFGRAARGPKDIFFLDTLDDDVVAFDTNFNTPGIIATGQNNAVDIAYDSATNTIYWTLEGNPGGGYIDGQVLKSPAYPDAGAPQAIATNQPRPHGIAVAGNYVYWTNLLDGSIRFAPK